VILGENGIEKIVEIDLSENEKAALNESASSVNTTNSLLTDL
jgi:malate dehydrogenase